MAKRILLAAAAIAVVLAGVAFVFGLRWAGQYAVRRTADPAAVVREIRALQELISVKFRVQKVVGLEELKFPVGAEKLLLIVQADVLAGIDLGELKESDVTRKGDLVVVRLPDPKILHVVVDEKATRVWDRQVTWWTPWVPYNNDLERQARLAADKAIREAALDMDILGEARRNAERTIRALLRAMGIEAVAGKS
ncbi:MAG: DUF4230 domain-containing protein [Bryobacteraceae bacterium]